MITKHFYRVDEVQAALLYSVGKGRAREAAFWCEELACSGFWMEAWATLLEAWLWFSLVTNPAWIQNRIFFSEEDDINNEEGKDILHQACYNLCISKKDNSLWAILITVGDEMPDRVGPKKPEGLEYESELDAYLCAAIFQGKAACAWWAVQKLNYKTDRIPDIYLSSLMESVGFVGPLWNRVALCAAVLVACTPDNLYDLSLNPHILNEIVEWRKIGENRKARLFAIPEECLYGRTRRGLIERSQSTIGELHGIQEILYDGVEDIDAFYERVFPDDIPDEWSLADQSKSHGPGVLRKGEARTLSKLGRIWMTHPCIYAWGFREWLDGLVVDGTTLQDVASIHLKAENTEKAEEEAEDIVMESMLSSVHKRLTIV